MAKNLLRASNLIFKSKKSFLYLVEDPNYEKKIVYKTLNEISPTPNQINRFYNEFEICQGLNIIGVRKVFDKGIIEGRYTLILEHVKGRTLKSIIDDGLLELSTFFEIVINITSTLNAIHENQIIHKDLSTTNILVDLEDNQINIIDFANASKFDLKTYHLGNPKLLEGTLAYISPEQSGRMNRVVDYRSDLYSLGIILYEALTGVLPFQSNDPLELVHAHLAKEPIPPVDILNKKDLIYSGVLSQISKIILKLLEKNADNRYQSTQGLLKDLKKCYSSLKEEAQDNEFQLASDQYAGKFIIPQTLYGREKEIQILIDSYESISHGKYKLLLVSGYSGVGKSSLVYEIHKPLTGNGGYFIQGKFDQYKRNIPFHAWIQALDEVVDFILTENDETVNDWKKKILDAIGKPVKILIDLIPKLELILGRQEEVIELPPLENQRRVNQVLIQFIKTLAKTKKSLFIFLDDWQWADLDSTYLLENLMKDEENEYLLVVCAFRDNELNNAHPFVKRINVLKEHKVPIKDIHLDNLSKLHVNQLIDDIFRGNSKPNQKLSEIIFKKTLGNAFFVKQTLIILQQEKAINYEHRLARWIFDPKTLANLKLSENVVELLIRKFKKLPPSTQEVLTYASCIGSAFSIEILANILNREKDEIVKELSTSVMDNLITFSKEAYGFAHDKIHQAVYSTLSEGKKQSLHLQIGRLLLSSIPDENEIQLIERIFDVVEQLNFGKDLISEKKELIDLARLNFKAGQKAQLTSAFHQAVSYYQYGIALLPQGSWSQNYVLTYDLYKHCAEALVLIKKVEEAEKLFVSINQYAATNIERAEIYYMRVMAFAWLGQHKKAFDIALEGLKLCNLEVPKDEFLIKLSIQNEKAQINLKLKKFKPDEFIKSESNSNIDTLVSLKTIPGAAFLAWNLMKTEFEFTLMVLKGVKIALEDGHNKYAAFVFALYCYLLAIEENYTRSYQFSKLAVNLSDKYPNHYSKAHVLSRSTLWGRLFGEHLKDIIPLFINGYEIGMQEMDYIPAIHNAYDAVMFKFAKGDSLGHVIDETEELAEICKKVQFNGFLILINTELFLMRYLVYKKEEDNLFGDCFDPDQLELLKSNSTYGFLIFNRIQQEFWFSNYRRAHKLIEGMLHYLPHIGTNIKWADFDFYYGLILANLFDTFSNSEKNDARKKIVKCRDKMKKRAEACLDNFEHKYILLEAELAKIDGQKWEAAKLYDKAILSAHQFEFVHIEAIANQLSGQFWQSCDKPDFASLYAKKARDLYEYWGAWAVANNFKSRYPEFFSAELIKNPQTTFTTSSSVLDYNSLFKAAQAISGELVLESLLEKMLTIVIENAGAQKGFLIEVVDNDLFLKVEGNLKQGSVVFEGEFIEGNEDYSQSIINYVARTSETVVISNASKELKFINDPYIRENKPKSILCFPLKRKGKLKAIFYLENNLIINAFTSERLEILNTLSVQIGISLENAMLYKKNEIALQTQTKLNKTFGYFVPHEFLKHLGYESILDVKLGGQVEGEMTVLFADIRSYTTLSEGMTPEENFKFINAYLKRVGPLISQNNGFVSQYYGDGLMAIFSNHPRDAVQTALQIQQALKAYNELRIRKDRLPIQVGIGIHTGPLMMGVIGDDNRMDTGIISDTVNSASRIEGLTKHFHAPIIIGNTTEKYLKHLSDIQYRFLGKVKVKGKQNILSVYEVYDAELDPRSKKKAQHQSLFEEALTAYFEKDFTRAAVMFKIIVKDFPEDKAAEMYLRKSALYMVDGIPENWDGVEALQSK